MHSNAPVQGNNLMVPRVNDAAAVAAGQRFSVPRLSNNLSNNLNLPKPKPFSAAHPHTKLYSFARALHALFFYISLLVLCTGEVLSDLDWILAAACLLWASNIIYGLMRANERMLFLLLHGGIFLFLLSRPIVGTFYTAWKWFIISYEATHFGLFSIYISMLTLYVVTVFCTALSRNCEYETKKWHSISPRVLEDAKKASTFNLDDIKSKNHLLRATGATKEERWRCLRVASLILFVFCAACALYAGSIKLGYMSGKSYEEYYLIDSSQYIPWIVSVFVDLMPFVLCSYLACLPKRKPAAIALIVYVATTLPMLMIGSRSDFVIAFIFAAAYYIIRALTDKNEVWITKHLIIAVCIIVPFGIAAMGAMDYLRAGKSASNTSMPLIVDALYNQGVSFTVLGRGYAANDQIQSLGFKFYSLGDLWTTITQGFIGQTFLGCTLLPTTNSVELATQGHSYAHAVSYFTHTNYLGGEGYGSSYLLELYADFGIAGIVVGSAIIAVGFHVLCRSIGKSWFWGLFALQASMSVFHMPRGYFIEWLDSIWSTRFWMAIVAIFVLAALINLMLNHKMLREDKVRTQNV